MKGMLLNPELVKAIAEGRKTVTRRLDEKPRYVVGETVYIKEVWNAHNFGSRWWHETKAPLSEKMEFGWTPVYKRNEPENAPPRWISPLIMPEFLAAIRVKITEVTQERLQLITPDEAIKEGVKFHKYHDGDVNYFDYYSDCYFWKSPTQSFRTLWDSVATRPGTRWADNPLVFAYGFEVNNVSN
jgi:hypothetical protein